MSDESEKPGPRPETVDALRKSAERVRRVEADLSESRRVDPSTLHKPIDYGSRLRERQGSNPEKREAVTSKENPCPRCGRADCWTEADESAARLLKDARKKRMESTAMTERPDITHLCADPDCTTHAECTELVRLTRRVAELEGLLREATEDHDGGACWIEQVEAREDGGTCPTGTRVLLDGACPWCKALGGEMA